MSPWSRCQGFPPYSTYVRPCPSTLNTLDRISSDLVPSCNVPLLYLKLGKRLVFLPPPQNTFAHSFEATQPTLQPRRSSSELPLAHDLDTPKRHGEAPIPAGRRRAGALAVIARPRNEAADVVVRNPPAVAAGLDTRRAASYPADPAHVALGA